MSLKILCSGFLFRHPIGGHTWHHLQYLIGLKNLGHEVSYFEDFGWKESCFNADDDAMTSDPAFGIEYMQRVFDRHGLKIEWCYLAEDETARGMPREKLAQVCRECDLYLNLSNLNRISEVEQCRRRVMVDTDPVFTQIGALGADDAFENYHALFTYGENVHRANCTMPTAGMKWLPTRQPVVLDLWTASPPPVDGPITTVMNWTPLEPIKFEGRLYGQKDQEFEPFFSLPRTIELPMQMAVNAPLKVRNRLEAGGWRLRHPLKITRDPWTYQEFLRGSRAEFCVAKHGYVTTRCGWFSDRTSAYLATGRPGVVQDTGFSDFLPCGEGLIAWTRPADAVEGIRRVASDPQKHGRAARKIVEEHFDAKRVLTDLLTGCM